LDLVQIAAEGLAPNSQCLGLPRRIQPHAFRSLEPLLLKTNPDGAGIIKAVGPQETLAHETSNVSAASRFLIVIEMSGPSRLVSRQTSIATVH
jgi:hypothetical protein